MANGLKFIPTPPPRQLHTFQAQYLNDESCGLIRFNRSLINSLLYPPSENNSQLAKFKSNHRASHLHITADQQKQFQAEFKLIEIFRRTTEAAFSHAFERITIPKQINIDRDDKTFLHRLIHDSDITCKPADKNLGLVLVDTAWYENELNRMLKDPITYRPLTQTVTDRHGKKRHTLVSTQINQLKDELTKKMAKLIKLYTTTIEGWYPDLTQSILKYLQHGVAQKDIKIPEIYLLIKVHKPTGLCGRPIVPCTRWLTTPASVVVDHLLQDILKLNPIPWLVKDTKSFVNELEYSPTLHIQSNHELVTADIATLYTNIDTPLGLKLVRQFLTEILPDTSESQWRIRLIMELLKFVMDNSYLTFKDTTYHQIDGTAMGTACAPTYANIIVYMLERSVLELFKPFVSLYRRYLDDVFACIQSDQVDTFKSTMNSLHPKLKFEFTQDSTQASFLDLSISKGTRFLREGRLDLQVHQKCMNLYLYIPFNSYHTDAAKRSFIQTELTRYIRNSSSMESYLKLRQLFWTRLRDRGYPGHFLEPIFNGIHYADRAFFLLPSSELMDSPLRMTRSPTSLCLLKRITRAERMFGTTSKDIIHRPAIFVIPFTPLSHAINTRQLLMEHWSLIGRTNESGGLTPPIIAYQSYPSIMMSLIYQKARRMNELRNTTSTTLSTLTQSTLNLGVTMP